MTDGPALGTASCSTKKTPVPTVAPTPNIVSWNVEILRARPPWPEVRDVGSTGLRRHICCWIDIDAAPRVSGLVTSP